MLTNLAGDVVIDALFEGVGGEEVNPTFEQTPDEEERIDVEETNERGCNTSFRIPSIKPTKSYKLGRICDVPGCGAKLSMYNPGKICFHHRKLEDGILS